MQYRQLIPSSCLKDYVRYFWTLESNDLTVSPKAFGPLADGCPGLIFQQPDVGQFYDQDHKPLPALFLYGQTVKRTSIYLLGRFRTVGVCFFPNTLASTFGFDANDLTDDCLDVNLITTYLVDELWQAATTQSRVSSLAAYLFAQIRKTNKSVDPLTQYAISQIISSKGSLSLPDMHNRLNLSERSFERRFNQQVGISPKLFSRVCRFQAALSQLKQANYDKLSDIAFENGYADQSHFIRTFKEFTGYSPYQFQKQSHHTVNSLSSIIE
jgi:AraC-like DNA-binding protein